MSKTQKVILVCLIVIAFIATGGYLLRGILHKSPEQDQLDSLDFVRERAREKAKVSQSKSDSTSTIYEQDLKKLNLPADSIERESVWSRYFNTLPKDTNGTATP